jgi:hypothetical protein
MVKRGTVHRTVSVYGSHGRQPHVDEMTTRSGAKKARAIAGGVVGVFLRYCEDSGVVGCAVRRWTRAAVSLETEGSPVYCSTTSVCGNSTGAHLASGGKKEPGVGRASRLRVLSSGVSSV